MNGSKRESSRITSASSSSSNPNSNSQDEPLSFMSNVVNEGEGREGNVRDITRLGVMDNLEMREVEGGDIGSGFLSFNTPLLSNPLQRVISMDIPALDFELPEAALPILPQVLNPISPTRTTSSTTAATTTTTNPITNSDRRSLIGIGLTSPRLIPGSPRTRFDLNPQQYHPPSSPSGTSGIPLKPILNTPQLLPSPMTSRLDEIDIGESMGGGGRSEAEVQLNLNFIDDEMDLQPEEVNDDLFNQFDRDVLNPERTIHKPRTPHPLYTPIINPRIHRRRRRRAMSIHSAKTDKQTFKSITKSKLRSAWYLLKYHKFPNRRSNRSNATSSLNTGSSISGTSSTSSSSSSSSSRSSNSTWNGWRFWKNSDSGSSSSGDSNDSDDEWEPPTPHFTLLTPLLSRQGLLDTSYPAHLLPSNIVNDEKPSTSTSSPLEDTSPLPSTSSTPPTLKQNQHQHHHQHHQHHHRTKPFELCTTSTLQPALERLQNFWMEKRQEDSISGDLGAGTGSRFSDEQPQQDANVNNGGGKRKRRGEEKAAKAEEMRLGKGGVTEEGPAWWLDVMCPTVADMREIRKILPLHPLTMEDILQQETREKMESFPSLGYYFVVFRALDESYFRYTSPPDVVIDDDGKSTKSAATGNGPTPRGKVDIVEGVGGKEGVEGVSVGAINLYLVVFPDGIISFHFEDISKHIERVQGRIHHLSVSRTMSSHWIAYSLMDSIVDAFFPLIDYIEGESNDVDSFLADPINSRNGTHTINLAQQFYDENITGISVVTDNSVGGIHGSGSSTALGSLESSSNGGKSSPTPLSGLPILNKTQTTVTRKFSTYAFKRFPKFTIPISILKIVPESWKEPVIKFSGSKVDIDSNGMGIDQLGRPYSLKQERRIFTKFDRAAMLKRITDARKLVTGLSRLLGPKLDVVKGLRKRMKLEHDKMFRSGDNQDINIYIGDLSDHIAAMHQSLTFYEAILAHDHPAYLGILRLTLHDAKGGTDIGILRLYVVTLTIIPMNIVIGMFSLNVEVPHNGDRYDHTLEDGVTPAGFELFYAVLGIITVVGMFMCTVMYFMFKGAKKQHKKRGPATLIRRK